MLRFSGGKKVYSILSSITSHLRKKKKKRRTSMYLFALTFAESYKEVFYSLKYINSNMSKAFIVLLTLFLAIFGRKKKGKKEFLIAYA